jgi:hypothetical protein
MIPPPPERESVAPVLPALFEEEPAVTLELSKAARGEEAMTAGSTGPSDKSGDLTRRLVVAAYQGEVQAILSEAYENLSDWIKAAMSGGEDVGKAFAAIRRLNRLIQRCQRKVRDLDKEDVLRLKQARAEQKQEQLRAKQIEQELTKRIQERKKRERTYLRDTGEQGRDEKIPGMGLTPNQLKAQIAAVAAALAQFSAPPPPVTAGSDMSFGGGEEGAVSVEGEISGGEAIP